MEGIRNMNNHKFRIGDIVKFKNSTYSAHYEITSLQTDPIIGAVYESVDLGDKRWNILYEQELELADEKPQGIDVSWMYNIKRSYTPATLPSQWLLDVLEKRASVDQKQSIHKDHEIIDNVVLNKTFKYCRTCKEEV